MTTAERLIGPRVVRWVAPDNTIYTPIEFEGRWLDRAQVAALATTAGTRRDSTRWLRFVMFDETELEYGWSFDLRIDAARCDGVKLPLIFGDSGYPIGVVEAITPQLAGAIPGTIGHCLVAVARLHETKLAEVAWAAVQERIFGGVCVELDSKEDEEHARITFLRVRLGDLESCHLRSARVLKSWEEPR
jgi:hypothetical protein